MESKKDKDEEVKVLTAKHKAVIKAYSASFGNVLKTIKRIKGKDYEISRTTFYEWRRTIPLFKAALDAIDPDEMLKDAIEAEFIDRLELKKLSDTMLIFALKTKCKDRGWGEHKEATNVNINITKEEREKRAKKKIEEAKARMKSDEKRQTSN